MGCTTPNSRCEVRETSSLVRVECGPQITPALASEFLRAQEAPYDIVRRSPTLSASLAPDIERRRVAKTLGGEDTLVSRQIGNGLVGMFALM